MEIIRVSENYRIIKRDGIYKLQYHANYCWRLYAEYKQEKAAVRNMDRLESYRK